MNLVTMAVLMSVVVGLAFWAYMAISNKRGIVADATNTKTLAASHKTMGDIKDRAEELSNNGNDLNARIDRLKILLEVTKPNQEDGSVNPVHIADGGEEGEAEGHNRRVGDGNLGGSVQQGNNRTKN